MNKKLNLFFNTIFIFGISICLFTFTSCQNDDDIVNPEINDMTCDSLMVIITMPIDSVLIAHVVSGTQPYTYLWSDGSIENSTLLLSGENSVTVSDANGCTASSIFEISNTNECYSLITLIGSAEDSLGSYNLFAYPSGGTSPYIYNWSNGSSSYVINVAEPGTYSVTVVDGIGCTTVENYQLIEAEVDECSSFTLNILEIVDDSYVFVPPVLVAEVSGGTPPYNYMWSNGVTSSMTPPMIPGIYSIIVNDSNGCTISKFYEVAVYSDQCTNLTIELNNYQDTNDNGHFIQANTYGGTEPYFYQWSTGDSSTNNIEVSGSGTYSVTITDFIGCREIAHIEF